MHIQHVSSKVGMETIRWWKSRGDVKVTAEVTPHHLLFTDEHIGDYDTNYKMNPPLRTQADCDALLAGLIEGVFDIISTDHAPHTPFEKAQDFISAPNGITGLDTALVSLYHHFVEPGTFGWDVVVKRYSAEPRRLMGLPVAAIEVGPASQLRVVRYRSGNDLHAGLHEIQIPEHAFHRPDAERRGRHGNFGSGNSAGALTFLPCSGPGRSEYGGQEEVGGHGWEAVAKKLILSILLGKHTRQTSLKSRLFLSDT